MMMGQNNKAVTDDAVVIKAVGVTAGELLKQGREAAGLTCEAVAERLNLLLTQVVALEQNDFKRFPGETFVKGHLRSYARLLKLDCDRVLQAYCGTTPEMPKAPAETVFNWRPVRLNQATPQWRRYSGLAAALAVIVAMWAWQQHRERSQVLSLTAATSDSVGGIDSALNSDAESALMDSVQLLSVAPKPAASNANAATQPANESGATTAQVAAASDADKLSLRFSADCWIEIKDRDNRVLVATLKHADEQLQIEGRGPFPRIAGVCARRGDGVQRRAS